MRLARFEPCEGIVDFAHREVFGYGRDMMPGGKVEHGLDSHRRPNPASR